jgi:Predicted metal-dependent hydrolase of the TIM-barrel fold
MKIFDAHAHLGVDVVFEVTATEDDLLKIYSEYGISGALVQPNIPRSYIEETRFIHDRIYKFVTANPTYYSMISINPHFDYTEIENEVQRCVELGFNSLKIHTLGYACRPNSVDGWHMFEVAANYNLPVMIHTGGSKFSYPMLLEEPIKKYNTTKIIIAHAGGIDGLDDSIELALKYENVYLEPSWVNVEGIKKIISTLGADKCMFSSDVMSNIEPSLRIFNEACGDNDSVLEKVFYLTAKEVFSL